MIKKLITIFHYFSAKKIEVNFIRKKAKERQKKVKIEHTFKVYH